MSDPPPPRPKPGSLRDRIAAFEQKPAASASSPAPPAPRPKPGGLAKWQPKPLSPPASPTSSATATVQREGGMSARDAQASIGQGGTLKERMAALQGMAAFGGAAAPAPPKPAQEKPKWRPPPQVAVAPPIRDDEEDSTHEPKGSEEEEAVLDKVSVPSATAEDDTPTPGAGESTEPESNDAEKEQDPEDEERQRRAAIAARMARLGGARVGMAPPVFGKKPVLAKEQKPVEQTPSTKDDTTPEHGDLERKSSMDAQSSATSSPESTKVPSIHSPPEAAEGATSPKPQTSATPEYFPPSSTSASPLSAGSADSQSTKSPSSMPVPSVPRRALPPRKKTPKTPSTPAMPEHAPEPTSSLEPTNVLGASVHVSPSAYGGASSVAEAQATASGDMQEEVGNVNASAEDYFDHSAAPAHDEPAVVATASNEIHDDPIAKDDVAEAERATSPSSDARPESPDDPEVYLKPKRDIEPEPAHDPALVVEGSTAPADTPSEVPAAEGQRSEEIEEDEEDEAVRRKRIAQRLAQTGGVNPLSAPREPSAEHKGTGDVPRKSSFEAAPGNIDPNVPVHNFNPTGTPSEPQGSAEGVGSVRKTVEDEVTGDDSIIREEHVGSDIEGQPPAAVPIHRQGERRIQGEAVRLEGEDEHEALRDEIDRDGQNETLGTRGEHEAVAGADETVEDVTSDGEGERADGEQVQDALEDNKDVPNPALIEPGHTREQRTAPVHPGDTPSEEDAAGPRYDEGFEASGDDNDMAPPRILRPLPAAPAAPTPVLSTRPDTGTSITRESPPTFPPPSANRRVSVPPPVRAAPASNVTATYEPASPRIATTKRTSIPPPVRAIPQPAGERAVLSPPPAPAPFVVASEEVVEEPEEGVESDSEEPQASPSPSPPPPPPPRRSSIQASAPPTPRKPSLPGSPPQSPRVPVSWTASSQHRRVSRESTSSYGERRPSLGFVPPPPPVPQVTAASAPPLPRGSESPLVPVRKLPPTFTSPQDEEHEVLDDSDGDPIDPRFHSPLKSSMLPSVVAPPPTALPPPVDDTPFTPQSVSNAPSPQEDSEEDAEQARRRTIAERMAKLGGIRFGAPPAPARRPPASAPSAEELPAEENTPVEQGTSAPQVPGEEDEEDEQARRQRITAKLAGMGGMRFGMIPGASPVPSHPPPAPKREEEPTPAIPSRAIPPARQHQPPADPESEAESNPMSDDGVQVEAEESEAEEVLYEDAVEDEYVEQAEEEELPPPPPSRSARPPIPTGRPPVPPPVRKPSIDTPPSPVVPLATRPTRKDSYDTVTSSSSRLHARAPQSDYVMVEQEDEESPPPPPRRPSRAQPSALPPPAMAEQNDTSGQWELPSIPTGGLDFGESSATSDLSASMLSEDSTYYPPPPAEKPLPPTMVPPSDHAHAPTQMSAEELRALWGRVGVQICEVATTLHERSKKTLIGDGSYSGFVAAVLAQVPNAQQPPMDGVEYGYLVYAQSGASVHTRTSEIMPGDIIVLEGAKLKGHKGLHAYTTVAGEGAPCIGVVCEFETKKLKVRSLQANQHVGQATVESVSYKLEDLKSGLIKVYRVLEA